MEGQHAHGDKNGGHAEQSRTVGLEVLRGGGQMQHQAHAEHDHGLQGPYGRRNEAELAQDHFGRAYPAQRPARAPCGEAEGRRLGQVLRARGRRWYRAELGSQSAFKFSAHLRLLSQRFFEGLQRRPVAPAQPPEQLVFPRQNTTSRRERPLTEYNARAAENDWRREIFLKPHFAPRRSKSAQTRLVPAVPSLVQVFGGFHIQLSAVAPVFIAGSSRAFCRSCPPDRSARCRTPARQNARRRHAAAHDSSRASKAPYLLRRRSRLAKGGKLPAENISLKAGRGTSH